MTVQELIDYLQTLDKTTIVEIEYDCSVTELEFSDIDYWGAELQGNGRSSLIIRSG